MKQTVYFNDFEKAFRDMDRENQFSYKGKVALFDYLEEYEESTDTEIELDIIALCCEYTEYESLKELQENYNMQSMEDLEDYTQVIMIGDTSFIIQNF